MIVFSSSSVVFFSSLFSLLLSVLLFSFSFFLLTSLLLLSVHVHYLGGKRERMHSKKGLTCTLKLLYSNIHCSSCCQYKYIIRYLGREKRENALEAGSILVGTSILLLYYFTCTCTCTCQYKCITWGGKRGRMHSKQGVTPG